MICWSRVTFAGVNGDDLSGSAVCCGEWRHPGISVFRVLQRSDVRCRKCLDELLSQGVGRKGERLEFDLVLLVLSECDSALSHCHIYRVRQVAWINWHDEGRSSWELGEYPCLRATCQNEMATLAVATVRVD